MILEINGQLVEVDDSFARLSPDQQESTVNEIAASFGPADDPNTTMGFLNRGLANTLGAPVDLVTAGLNRIPGVEIQSPMGGSESFQSAMGIVNADVANRPAETLLEHAAQGGGEAAGALFPALSASRALQGAQGVTGAVASQMSAPFVSQPIRAASAELAAGGGAAMGSALADDFAEDGDAGPIAQTVAALTGGALGAMGPQAITRASQQGAEALPVTGAAIRGIKGAVAPFTEQGARVRAENRIQGLVSDPQEAATAMMQDNPGNLTPAQMSNDTNLLALERTVAENNPQVRDRLADRAAESADAIKDDFFSLAPDGTPQHAIDFLERRRDQFRSRLQSFKDLADRRATARIERLNPIRRESENSVIVGEELQRAYERARTQERQLWNAVPKSAEVPTSKVRETYASILAETPRARIDDIPREASALLSGSGFGDQETVLEMHGLYSQLRQRAREALGRSTPNGNKARIANELADAILVDLGATGKLPTAVGVKINEARAFSREMNEVFRQGAVRSFTSQSALGGPSYPTETALSRAVSKGGPRAAVAVDQIADAAGDEALEPLQDFMRGRLMDRAAGRGSYDPKQAAAFARANSEALSRFPELQGDISAANTASRTGETRTARVDGIVARLDNPRQNAGAAFLNASAGDEVAQAIFKAKIPVQAAAALRREAAKDTTGRALEGIKRGTLDFLIGRASGRYAADGTQELSGNQLFGDLQDPRQRAVLGRLFNPAEISRMERLSRQLQGLQGARNARSLDSVIDDAPNAIINFVGSTIAARQGAKAGQGVSGASLLTANFASKRMRDLLGSLTNDRAERLIQDAITDRDLFVALMTNNTDPARVRRAEKRISEWLIGTYGVVAAEERQLAEQP